MTREASSSSCAMSCSGDRCELFNGRWRKGVGIQWWVRGGGCGKMAVSYHQLIYVGALKVEGPWEYVIWRDARSGIQG